MRRIKLGKGLLRSLFPSSSKKKKSSSKKNKSASSAASRSSTSNANNGSFNCPPILGGGRRSTDHRPYELHQEGASSPPTSDDEGRDNERIIGGSAGVGEQPTPQLQQADGVKRDADDTSPIAVGRSSDEQNNNEVEREVAEETEKAEATEKEQQQEDIIPCASEPKEQHQEDQEDSYDSISALSPVSSPSREEARRRAIARQQRILSQASTRFQALSETATIDTSGFSYCSPPHLQRRRWQQHIGRQTKPQTPNADGDEEKPQESSPQGIRLPPKQQLPQPNKNCSSVVFYGATPTRDVTGQFTSPTCVADTLEHFEASNPCEGNKNAVSPKSAVSPNTMTSSSNNSISTSTATGNNINFFILLLCPQSRIFEVVEISDAPLESTIGDVLTLIPQHITDVRLLKKKYIGLCRPADRTEFIDLALPAFLKKHETPGEDCTPFDFIHENDVLVAILKGSTCYQMSKISKPILRNPKFKEMIRRRRRQSAADRAARKKKRKSKKKLTDTLHSPTKAIYVPDDCSVVSGITCAKAGPSGSNQTHRAEDPTSLSKMLETLSKKLHEVEEDGAYLPGCDDSSMGSSSKQRSVVSSPDQVKRKAVVSDTSPRSGQDTGFKMSPKMLAMELAQTIEDIFANRNVEIVAVDADDNDLDDSVIGDEEDDDSDTFVSARSHRTKSTVGTLKSIKSRSPTLPRNVVTPNHRTKTSPRQFKFTETMEDNALAAQIEAMAAQADAAFEDRSKKNSSRRVAQAAPVVEQAYCGNESPVAEAAVAVEGDCDGSFQSTFDALSTIECDNADGAVNVTECENMEDGEAKVTTKANKDVVARQFLNASTSTVSKMVADNQGRVNEMHVLESLGCTIVCIAANYLQQARQSGKSSPPIESKDVFQSATFLAFMVSGQRYLAKVTEK